MVENPSKTVSLQSSDMNWALIDNRADELGLDRSKYTQALYQLDINYNLLSNNKILDKLKNPDKIDLRKIDVVIVSLLVAVFILMITVWVIFR